MKRRIIACMMVISMLALSACGNRTNEKDTAATGVESENRVQTNGTNEEAKGRYVEDEISLPFALGGLLKVKELEDGTIRLVGRQGLYDSYDKGKSFVKLEIDDLVLDETTMIMFADCNKNGEMIIGKTVYKQSDELYNGEPFWEPEKEQVFLIDKDLNMKEIEVPLEKDMEIESGSGMGTTVVRSGETTSIDEAEFETSPMMGEDAVMKMYFLPNENYLVSTSMGSIFQLDKESGEKIVEYAQEDYIYLNSAVIWGNQLVIDAYMELYAYDIDTGAIQEVHSLVQEFMQMKRQESGGMMFHSPQISMTADEGALYIASNEGIHRYMEGSTTREELVNGYLHTLSNPEYGYTALEKTEDNSFYVGLIIASSTEYTEKLVRYRYDAEAQITPSQELKVYALTDTPQIRQAVSVYQQNNPGVYINLEIGMPKDEQVTATDVIRNLNTSIMAGDGPDIILLDGLPVDSYIEKEALIDLAEIVEEVNAGEGLFENIVKTYEEEGKIYAVPTRFTVDVLIAQEELLNTYKDLNGLAEALEGAKMADSSKENIFNAANAKQLVENLYNTSSGSWTKEDGTLNEEAIKEFITALSRIYDVMDKEEAVDDEMFVGDAMTMRILDALVKGSEIATVSLSSIDGMAYIVALMEQIKGSDMALLNGQTQNSYMPVTTVGVSAKSENQDIAKEFVKTLLSKELQASSVDGGLPVNKVAFEQLISQDKANDVHSMIMIESDDGRQIMIDIKFPKEEVFIWLQDGIEKLEVPANINSIIKETVTSEIVNGLENEKSVDEIAASILQTINLYLSE